MYCRHLPKDPALYSPILLTGMMLVLCVILSTGTFLSQTVSPSCLTTTLCEETVDMCCVVIHCPVLLFAVSVAAALVLQPCALESLLSFLS